MDFDALLAERVIRGNIRIAPSPVVALRLMQLLSDEDTTIDVLTRAIGQDQALAAIVLRLANSAAHRRSTEVVSLRAAIVAVGRKVLREMSMAKELHERTLGSGPLVALRRRAWRESLTCAQVASWVAPMLSASSEDAFVAGLLHDIGRVAAIGLMEQLHEEFRDQVGTRTEERWWTLVEVHHVTLGSLLAQSWGLPSMLAQAIAQHHLSSASTPLLQTLRVADQIVGLLDSGPFLSASTLGSIAGLKKEHCEALAAQLPLLPETSDAFREPALAEMATVVDYELRLPEALSPDLQVTLTCEGLVTRADVLRISEPLLGVRSSLKPGQLVRVRAGEANFHARVTASNGEAAELAPWALNQAQADQWRRFVLQANGA